MHHAVLITRLPGDEYQVVAVDWLGREFRRRVYRFGSNRRDWAIQQAKQWAACYGIPFDESVIDGE